MADDDEKTTVESGDKAETEGEGSTEAKKGGNKMILFGGIGVGAIVLGVVLTLFVIKPMMSGSDESADATEEVAEHDGGKDESAHGESKKEKPKKKPRKKASDGEEGGGPEILAVKDIVINPAGTGGSRFLSVSFAFEVESAYLAAEFEERAPVIRDALITILSSKTVAQLTDPKQKEIVRYQIKKRISQLMETDELAGVYYTDFVLQ
jgi:flagellar FliL protein